MLTRTGHRFHTQRIARREIVAVDIGTELLDGWLTAHGLDGSRIEVRFNGSSLREMTEFADRAAGWPTDELPPGLGSQQLSRNALGREDVGVVNAFNTFAAYRTDVQLITAYAGRDLVSHQPFAHRFLRGAPHLSAAVLAATMDWGVVFSRREWLHHSRKPDLSSRRLLIRRQHVAALSTTAHPTTEAVVDVAIRAGASTIRLTMPTDNAAALTKIGTSIAN